MIDRARLKSTVGCGLLLFCPPCAVAAETEIVLRGFSQSNYAMLDRALGKEICVTGKLSINTAGVYFALRPIRYHGLIDVGFSRIQAGRGYELTQSSRLHRSARHTVCGLLEESTPFKGCIVNECKWYRLKKPKLRR